MSMSLTERTQVLLTPEQRARVEREAARRDVSVGAIIREAIDHYTVPRTRPREEALAELFSLEAPVDDWQTMEEEIRTGALG